MVPVEKFQREIKESNSSNIDVLITKAQNATKQNKIYEAVKLYLSAIKISPDNAKEIKNIIFKLLPIKDYEFKVHVNAVNNFRRFIVQEQIVDLTTENSLAMGVTEKSISIADESDFKLGLITGIVNDNWMEDDEEIVSKKLKATEAGFDLSETDSTKYTASSPGEIKQVLALKGESYDFGVASYQGSPNKDNLLKPKEDYFKMNAFSCNFKNKTETILMGGVFDGHSGGDCAYWVSRNVEAVLQDVFKNKSSESSLDIDNALSALGIVLDKSWHREKPDQSSGCTACIFIMIKGKNEFWILNIGDSRAVFNNKSKAIQLSEDSKVTKKVVADVKSRGGLILINNTGYENLYGVLAMVKAIGDYHLVSAQNVKPPMSFKIPGLSARGDVVRHTFDPDAEDNYLVLATDGLWDCIGSQEAIDLVNSYAKDKKSVKEIAQILVEDSFEKGTKDDTTAMVIKLSNKK